MAQKIRSDPASTPLELWRGFKPVTTDGDGSIAALYIASRSGAPMVSVPEVRAFADRGLEGDRFFMASWSAAKRPDKAVSLIEQETLEAAAAELGVPVFGEKTRRNIVTRGMALGELLHREFVIGTVRMRGIRLFEPCAHMEKLSGIAGAFRVLEYRGGLKAEILSDGLIRVDDAVRMATDAVAANAPA